MGVRQIEVSLAFADVELSAPSGTWGVLVVTPIDIQRLPNLPFHIAYLVCFEIRRQQWVLHFRLICLLCFYV